MYQDNKDIFYFKSNLKKKNIKNIIESLKKRGYSDKSSNNILSNNIMPIEKEISLKTNYISSLTSIITNKHSTESISNNSYTEKKTNKNNPIYIFDNHKSLFTSIDDSIKIAIGKNKSLDKYKEKNKSINNLYNNISSKKNSNKKNLNQILKKLALLKYEMESINQNENQIKLIYSRNNDNKKKIKFIRKEYIPAYISKKKNFSFINNKNVNMRNNIQLYKDKNITYSLSKDKLPNISIEDNLNNKINRNILTDGNIKININKNKKDKKFSFKNRNNLITFSRTLITFDKKKHEVENKKNHDFIKKIKNKQLMDLVEKFKILEKKNFDDEYKSYKNSVFPIDTIKLLVSKRKELTIDKLRNEYFLKLENVSFKNY